MHYLTRQEKIVLLSLAIIIFVGTVLQLVCARYPTLNNLINLTSGDVLVAKVDINTATALQLEAVPYIGKYTAENIVDYRRLNGDFDSTEKLQLVKGIREKNYNRFCRYLKVNSKKHVSK